MTDVSSPPTILILTVGGSEEPLIRAIEQAQPHGLLLIASSAEGGHTSSEPVANQLAATFRAARPDRQADIIAVPADDPDVGFNRIVAAIEGAARRRPGHRLIADYTGGTKSMSGALLMAAFQRRLEVQLTTGARTDLTKVVAGTETARRIDTRLMGLEADLATALTLAEGGDYSGAAFLLTRLKDEVRRKGLRPSKDFGRRLENSLRWSNCLAAWDRFDHRTAQRLLQSAWETGEPWAESLEVGGHRAVLDEIVRSMRDPSVGLCRDLLANARRRYHQRRYDDALARLYRFTEACAQTQLFKRWGLRTDELDEADLPDFLKGRTTSRHDPRLKKRVHQIALNQTIQLLEYRDREDALARAYLDAGEFGPTWLRGRNNSILAHGYQIVQEEVVEQAFAWIDRGVRPAMNLQPMAPFPARPHLADV